MIIQGYVNMIEGILEGKSMGVIDIKRKNALMDLLGHIKKKDDVRNVCDMAMFMFQSNMLAGRLNDNAVQFSTYSDYLSALAEIAHLYFSKPRTKKI